MRSRWEFADLSRAATLAELARLVETFADMDRITAAAADDQE